MIKTRAIVLHRFAYSDSSFIVKALTEECGVVSFIIKGAKRKESPFKGALDPLALSEVVFRQNPSAELQFIKEASIVNWHGTMRQSLLNLAVAQVMAEVVLRYAPQGVPLPDEFQLLQVTLARLDSPTAPEGIFAQWLLDTCDLWGYHLELGVCSRCEGVLTESAADFFPESGALICKQCDHRIYPRINPAVIVGVINGDRLLLTKYKTGFGHNALVAGFTEIGETLEETVQREVMEEVGLKVKNIRYYKSQPWGIALDILTGFYCEADGDDKIRRDDSELKYAEWVKREAIELQPTNDSLTNEMMRMFKEGKVR